MDISTIEKAWGASKIIAGSFKECRESIAEVYSIMNRILDTPEGTPAEFMVNLDKVPKQFFSLRNNIFSALFQASYHLLEIPAERRLLYAKINRLFRIWVTSADNLLDNENKMVVPLKMKAESHMMHQVIAVMAADRVLKELLDQAVEAGTITQDESRTISYGTLQVLLPSAAEEALEEKGVEERPDPDYVLYTIHRMKTATLFQIPFLGPESIEQSVDREMMARIQWAFDRFGLGCQLLDDIRDISRDYLQKRHNYILSKIFFNNRKEDITKLRVMMDPPPDEGTKIFKFFPETVQPAAKLARAMLNDSLQALDSLGLHMSQGNIKRMIKSMFAMLDVEELNR